MQNGNGNKGGSGGGRGQGKGGGRGGGAGQGRGRMQGGTGIGPGGNCVCQSCGQTLAHQLGTPCTQLKCPACGGIMTRQS